MIHILGSLAAAFAAFSGRQGHFVYDKLSFDGQELVSERLAQLFLEDLCCS